MTEDKNNNPSRLLSLYGVFNCRDLGGYITKEGAKVKWGKLFRSGELFGLTHEDKIYLRTLGLKLIFDLRDESEHTSYADPELANVKNIKLMKGHALDSKIIDLSDLFKPGNIKNSGKPGDLLIYLNKNLVKSHTTAFAEILNSALKEDNLPMLWHCSSGKDRTGAVAALFLIILGVPLETIMEDYLATNIYAATYLQSMITLLSPGMDEEDIEILKAIFQVRSEYLNAFFQEVIAQYGSMEAYIEKSLGFNDEKINLLKTLLLDY